jgi:predicted P-loop ATPase
MRKAEVEKVKAQITRQEDRTRPAYGHFVVDAKRPGIFWGSTNDKEYLRSQTGNRRFLPIPVGRIDLEGLKRDRDQLWAEASEAEVWAESVLLPESLWEAAGIEQEARTESDPWADELGDVADLAAKSEASNRRQAEKLKRRYRPQHYVEVWSNKHQQQEQRISSAYILGVVLSSPIDQQNAAHGKRLGLTMRKLGWHGPEDLRIGGPPMKGYRRAVETDPLAE